MSSTMNTLRHQLPYKLNTFFTQKPNPNQSTILFKPKTPPPTFKTLTLSHPESQQLLVEELKTLTTTESSRVSSKDVSRISSKDVSRIAIFGAVSVGVACFLMGFDDQKALALGPEGPLMEEFWDNMRRYALYALTVSTGALSVLIEPIVELMKNPISAVLIIIILGGGFFIVSQVVSAMVGLSDFSYEYNY